MVSGLINANPVVYEKKERRARSTPAPGDHDESSVEAIDQLEIFPYQRHKRSRAPLFLGTVESHNRRCSRGLDKDSHVRVTFTPTVEHCGMAVVIGLCLRVKLMRSLPPRFKVDIRLAPGSHATEAAVNKQLNDKERVAGVLEIPNLVDMVDECLAPSYE